MGLSQKQLFWILNALLLLGPLITIGVFFFSRQDPNMRVVAQTAAITMGGQLITIFSTMLIGPNKNDPASLPPGSVAQENTSTTVKTPPITGGPVATAVPAASSSSFTTTKWP